MKYTIEITTDADLVRMFECSTNMAMRLQNLGYEVTDKVIVGEKNGNI